MLLAGALASFVKANDGPSGVQSTLTCSFDVDTAWLCIGESFGAQLNTSGATGSTSYIWKEGSKPSMPSSSQSWYDFIPTATGFDTLSVTVSDQAGEQCSSTIILATLGNCVWPGDANGDGIANHFDLLNIGRGMGLMGPPRPDAHTNWIGQASHSWGQLAPGGADYTHADADGDGTIHLQDIQAIHSNYTFIQAATQPTVGTGPAFYLEFSDSTVSSGDTLVIDVMLGDAANPADSVYGLAFSLNFADWLIDSGSVQLDMTGSWLGTDGVNMTGFARDFSQAGQVDVALTRIDQQEQRGQEKLIGIVVVIEDIVGKKAAVVADNISLGNVRAEAFDGRQRQVVIRAPQISVGLGSRLASELDISIFPNPATSSFNIDVPGAMIQSVEIIGLNGKKLNEFLPTTNQSKAQFMVPEGLNGLFALKISTSKGLITKPLLITN
jgi:hypothetical protein